MEKEEEIQRLKEEIDKLKMWKKEALIVFQPIFDFENPEMKLGESKVEFIIKLAKERDHYMYKSKID